MTTVCSPPRNRQEITYNFPHLGAKKFPSGVERRNIYEQKHSWTVWKSCIQRLRNESTSPEGYLQSTCKDHQQRFPSGTGCRKLCSCCHERMGSGAWRYPFHPLVPADDRHHRWEAWQFSLSDRCRRSNHGIFRKRTRKRWAGRVQLPVRRFTRYLRSPRLYRMGSYLFRIHQGTYTLYPNCLLFLQRRGTR